jgi:hypothetical protein
LGDCYFGFRNDRWWVYSFFDHYAITLGIIGMICGGFAMGGIAQGLRLLVAIARTIRPR